MKFLLIFFILSLVNVAFSTVRSIITINGDKLVASIVSALYFGYYNIVLIYTVADFPLWQKIVITFVTNLIGVYVVKLIEERRQQEKLWKIEATIPVKETDNRETELINIRQALDAYAIQYNYIDIGKYFIVNCYCYDKEETKLAKDVIRFFGGKGFASEAKISI